MSENKYLSQLQNEYDLNDLKENAEAVIGYDGENLLSYYLGTVFSLTPSGKYYTPWACSNVEEEEAEEDAEYFEAWEEFLSGTGASLESGEGDPCDLFLVWYVGEGEEEQEEDED